MTTIQDKINGLQREVDALDQKMITTDNLSGILFAISLALPFAIGILLYMTKFGFVQTDDEVDRKKVLKYSLIISAVAWLLLWIFYMSKKIK